VDLLGGFFSEDDRPGDDHEFVAHDLNLVSGRVNHEFPGGLVHNAALIAAKPALTGQLVSHAEHGQQVCHSAMTGLQLTGVPSDKINHVGRARLHIAVIVAVPSAIDEHGQTGAGADSAGGGDVLGIACKAYVVDVDNQI